MPPRYEYLLAIWSRFDSYPKHACFTKTVWLHFDWCTPMIRSVSYYISFGQITTPASFLTLNVFILYSKVSITLKALDTIVMHILEKYISIALQRLCIPKTILEAETNWTFIFLVLTQKYSFRYPKKKLTTVSFSQLSFNLTSN